MCGNVGNLLTFTMCELRHSFAGFGPTCSAGHTVMSSHKLPCNRRQQTAFMRGRLSGRKTQILTKTFYFSLFSQYQRNMMEPAWIPSWPHDDSWSFRFMFCLNHGQRIRTSAVPGSDADPELLLTASVGESHWPFPGCVCVWLKIRETEQQRLAGR